MAAKPQRLGEVEEASPSHVSEDQVAAYAREAVLRQATKTLDGALLDMQMSSFDVHPQTLQRWIAELELVQKALHEELG